MNINQFFCSFLYDRELRQFKLYCVGFQWRFYKRLSKLAVDYKVKYVKLLKVAEDIEDKLQR